MLMRVKFIVGIAVLVAVGLTPLAVEAGNLVVNGDFEDTTDWGAAGSVDPPFGWVSQGTSMKNPAEMQIDTAAIGGTGTSAYMSALKTTTTSERRQLGQMVLSDAEWTLSMDVATEYAGTATDRTLQLILQPEDGQRLMFRIVDSIYGGMGGFEFYRGSQGSWTPLPGLESCITYSTDLANAPLAHEITISGHFDQAAPTYDVTVVDPYGTTYSATGIDWFESGSAPNQGSGIAWFSLPTFNSTGDYVIDNVSMPSTSGELVPNGDFEDTTGWGDVGTEDIPASWMIDPNVRKNPADILSGTTAIGGEGTSAYCPANPTANYWEQRQMYQNLEVPTSAEWTLEMDAACTDSDDPTLRVLNFFVMTESDKRMMFRVVGSDTGDRGAVQFYRGSQGAWTSIPGLEEAFDFSTDVTTAALVNHIAIDGHFEGENPTWDISVTDSSDTTLSANGIDWFESGTLPAADEGIRQLALTFLDCVGDVLLDNIYIPDGIEELIAGDANGDGKVDGSDVTILAGNWQAGVGGPDPETITWEMGDFNGDGQIDGSDVTILAGNWQAGVTAASASVPEPSTIVLLVGLLLSLGCIRRQR